MHLLKVIIHAYPVFMRKLETGATVLNIVVELVIG